MRRTPPSRPVRRSLPLALFFVSMLMLGGATCGDGRDGGLPIGQVQGRGHTSPLLDAQVTVRGHVTAILDEGFVLQGAGDGDEATSDAVYVDQRLGASQLGAAIEVTGTVAEIRPGGRDSNLTVTTITEATVTGLDGERELPAPIILGRGGRAIPTEIVDDDSMQSFDPDTDGIDFYESLEGMLVQVNGAVVISSTSRYGEVWVLADGGQDATNRNRRGGVTLSAEDQNPERLQVDDELFDGRTPALGVGDRLESFVGILNYDFGSYEILPLEPIEYALLESKPVSANPPVDDGSLTVATFNVLNLGGDEDDRAFYARANVIVHALHAPALVALQEMQDDDGPEDSGSSVADGTFGRLIDAIESLGGPRYDYAQIDPVDGEEGGQPGGNIRNGFLFDPMRITLVRSDDNPARLGTGREAFARSRVPIVATFQWRAQPVHVVNVHLSSKGGSSPMYGAVRPPVNGSVERRLAQALAVRGYVDALLAGDPDARVIVTGDFNEFDWNAPLRELTAGGALHNLTLDLPPTERATYIYEGNAQALDHVLVSAGFENATIEVVHANTGQREDPASDHDPVLVRLR